MKNENKITIVIISHKSTYNVLRFIEGLSVKYNILIIDNSNDNILKEKIKNKINVKLFTIKNKGYGAAINYANNLIKTDYFFVFNPDILDINDKFIDFFSEKTEDFKNDFLCAGPRFLNVDAKSHKQSDVKIKTAKIDAINGACMLINKKNFDLINGFDENFFLFFEENDFCKRGVDMNLKIYQFNEVGIIHEAGTSVEVNDLYEKKKLQNLRTWHFIWSKFYFFKKHYSYLFAIIYFTPILIRNLYRIFIYFVTNNNDKRISYLIRIKGLIASILLKKSYKRI